MSNVQTFNDGSAAQVLDAMTPEQEAAAALQHAMQVTTRAKSVVITTQSEYDDADAAVGAIKSEIKKNDARRDELVRPLNTVVGKINGGFKAVEAALKAALDDYRRPMSAFQAELTRQREEAASIARMERVRLEAEARAKVEAEMAEAKRLQAEADAARAGVDEDDPFAALLAEDDAAEAQARADASAESAKQAIRDSRAIEVPVEYVAKVTGSASKTYVIWEFEITDPALVPMAYRPIDTAAIARDVKAGKDECSIPGVRVFSRIEVK